MRNIFEPYAIFDMTTFGTLRELSKSKIKASGDVSVMWFDNIPSSEMVTPPLTTIDPCTYEMGSMAAEVLINSLEDENRKYVSTSLKPTLVIRESTSSI